MGENAGYWTGEFSGSFESDEGDSGMFHKMSVRCPAWQKFNFIKGTSYAEGVCYGKDLEGNEVYFDWTGSEQKLGQPGKGTFSYTGGTGKYEGLTGNGGFFIGSKGDSRLVHEPRLDLQFFASIVKEMT